MKEPTQTEATTYGLTEAKDFTSSGSELLATRFADAKEDMNVSKVVFSNVLVLVKYSILRSCSSTRYDLSLLVLYLKSFSNSSVFLMI